MEQHQRGRRYDQLTQHVKRALFIVFASWCCAVAVWAGTVTLDGTVGPKGSVLPDANSVFTIDASLGTVRGNNLFHSFGQFNLSQGDTASFTGPANILNILARVTGGAPSIIDGTIDSTAMPNANFFLINPFGVVFGQHAQVNVSGSFAVTTADYVKLADGGRFDARNPANDVLTAAPVSAFGFLGPTAAPITLSGVSTDPNNPSILTFLPDGKSIWLVGGNIEHDGFLLGAPSGEIVMVSVASAGELPVNVDDPNAAVDTTSFSALGNLTLANGAAAYVSGTPGGRVVLEADRISILGLSSANADNFGDTSGSGGIELTARTSITLDQSTVSAVAAGNGDGGSIAMTAPSIHFVDADVETSTILNGKGGDIQITAGDFTMGGGGQIGVTATGAGTGGSLILVANQVHLEEGATIFGLTLGGPAGNITVLANSVEILAGGQINFNGEDGGGVAGDIHITAHTLINDGNITSSSEFGGGGGGNIVLDVNQVGLHNGGQITATSDNGTPAGNVTIHGTDVIVDGTSAISSAATAGGTAGSVTLQLSGSLSLQGGGMLSVSSAQGAGGDITVTAGSDIRVIDGQITAQAQADGGNIHLTSPSLVYLLDSQITAASDTGHGGNVTIDPPLVILNNSLISANAVAGNGGNIAVVSGLFLTSQSTVTASSQFGLQGSVTITAPDVDLTGSLLPLNGSLLDATTQLAPQCGERLPGGVSSFLALGRGGVPVEPDALLPAFGQEDNNANQ